MLPIKTKQKIYSFLRWSEKWAKTDMVYLAKGGFWLTLGQIISSISGITLGIAFANLLPKDTYGQYKYILSIVGLLSIPTLSGMGTALLQAIARGYEGSIIPALKTKLKWGLISSIASFVLSAYYYYNHNLTLTFSFIIAGFFIPLMNAFGIYGPLLNGRKLFQISTKYNIIIKTTATFLMIAVLLFTKNLFIILLAYFAPYTFLRILFFLITLKKIKPNKKEKKDTISYGKFLTAVRILALIGNQLDKILLWHYVGAVQLAIYSFARAMPNQILSLLKSISSPLIQPKFAAGDTKQIKKSFPTKIIRLFLVVFIIVFLYIISAPFIFKFLFPKYSESIIYSQLFALLLLFYPRNLFMEIFIAKMKKKNVLLLSTSSQILKITLYLLLLPTFKIYGILISEFLVLFYASGLSFYLFKKI